MLFARLSFSELAERIGTSREEHGLSPFDGSIPDTNSAARLVFFRSLIGFAGYQPAFVVVKDAHAVEELYARLLSFGNGVRPVSAHCRVLTKVQAESMLRNEERAKTLPLPLPRAAVGMIVGEMFSQLAAIGPAPVSPLLAWSTATLSHALSRGLCLGSEDFYEIAHRWQLSRELVFNNSTSADPKQVMAIWNTVLQMPNAEQRPADAIRLIEAGATPFEAIGRTFGEDMGKLFHVSNVPRERRLARFLELVDRGRSPQLGTHEGSFVAGLLASLITPGDVSAWQTVVRHEARWPGITIWYGLCAGLSREFDARMGLSPLVARLRNELGRRFSVLEPPECDISVDEVLIVGSREWGTARLMPSVLSVELVPGVVATGKWPAKDLVQSRQSVPVYHNAPQSIQEPLFDQRRPELLPLVDIKKKPRRKKLGN